jgi:DNA repair photolyase
MIQISPNNLRTITPELRRAINPALLDPVEYRKSGLSLNHIIGCPLDCAYCVRHLFGNFEMKRPCKLMGDEAAVEYLLTHHFFQRHVTPIQLLNRATDPFLPTVKPHTFNVIESLDRRALRNHVLIITRFRVTREDCLRLRKLRHIRLTLLVTFSGIDDDRIEPVDSNIAAESLRLAHSLARNYRTILYWRPVVPGLNDSEKHMRRVVKLSHHAHATVFTGLFYRGEIKAYFEEHGLTRLYNEAARRKILPKELEARILRTFSSMGGGRLFRKTSCGVSYAHQTHDYNGHYGIRELCDICPLDQIQRCRDAWLPPNIHRANEMAMHLGATTPVTVDHRAVHVEGLDEQRRYFIQHSLGYQVHDRHYPHNPNRHGRAEIGWDGNS